MPFSQGVGVAYRQAVADVEELKKKIDQLQTRSNALESALKTLQSAVSDDPHPLLQDNPGPMAMCPGASPCIDSPSSANGDSQQALTAEEEDALDAFGTSPRCPYLYAGIHSP